MCARGKGYEKYDTYTFYPTPSPTPTPPGMSVRVSKALGSKGYGKMRLSVIYNTDIAVPNKTHKAGDVQWTYVSACACVCVIRYVCVNV